MTSFTAVFAPLAVLLPVIGAAVPGERVRDGDHGRDDAPHQVRIEQRVIIRISPGTPVGREQSMAMVPRQPISQPFKEERTKDCVPISTIVGVEPGQNNRLVLFMSDRRILTAELDRSCSARDFYSGFYIERNEDGRLCSGRDKLQSRAGASCGVAHLNRLVAKRD
jgi:hypothetical protein